MKKLLKIIALLVAVFVPLTSFAGFTNEFKEFLSNGEHLTLEEYQCLDEKHKELIRGLASEELSGLWGGFGQKTLSHPILDNEMMKKMKKISLDLMNDYKDTDFVFIGASLSYICRICMLLKQNNDTNSYGTNAAFSGAFLDDFVTIYSDTIVVWYEKEMGFDFSKIDLKGYMEYLCDLETSPAYIIERYKKYKRKTVFVDYCNTGSGLASFLFTLFTYALENNLDITLLKEAISIHCLLDDGCDQKKIDGFNIYLTDDVKNKETDALFFSIKARCQFVSYKLRSAMDTVGVLLKENDRLVRYYPKHYWGKKDPFDYKIPYQANLILFSLYDWFNKNHIIEAREI